MRLTYIEEARLIIAAGQTFFEEGFGIRHPGGIGHESIQDGPSLFSIQLGSFGQREEVGALPC